MAVYCPRCGSRFLLDARLCWACADGEADPDRAREVLQAAEAGQSDALRVLGTIDDRQAVPILLEGARHLNADIRRAALSSLGRTADEPCRRPSNAWLTTMTTMSARGTLEARSPSR